MLQASCCLSCRVWISTSMPSYSLTDCHCKIKHSMAYNFLQCNLIKTKIFLIGTKSLLSTLAEILINTNGLLAEPSSPVRNLGIIFETPAPTLRSSGSNHLTVPKFRFSSVGDRAFCVTSPTLWNALPLSL